MTVATQYAELPVGELHPHPLNRKRFDPVRLRELEASIRASGVLTTLLVRPNGKGHQILAGERRWKVAKAIGLETLPCRIRDIPDAEAIEFLIIENLQREDVHPLEEAQGYVELMKKSIGYDVAKIAERVGRSEKYVYDRLKLLSLTPDAKKLFLADTITAGHAIILARLKPGDQARAIKSERSGNGQVGGLFTHENTLFSPTGADDDEAPRKPVSVREFQGWVDEHVRFDLKAKDLPDLFPETASTLAAATVDEEKVVHITHEYQLRPDVRDEKTRTFGSQSWKRADGNEGSKTCEYAVTGVIVVGYGRGEAFKVCVEKKKCSVHWAQEKRDAARRAKSSGSGAGQPSWQVEQEKRQEEYRREERERARWQKAAPEILEATVVELKKAPAGTDSALGRLVLAEYHRYRHRRGIDSKLMPRGRTAEDLVRYLGFLLLADSLGSFQVTSTAPRLFKPFGIDPKEIVDAVAPKVEVAKVQTSAPKKATPKKATKKRLAGDVRRARNKARAKK